VAGGLAMALLLGVRDGAGDRAQQSIPL
jgi:hypothetical protein